MTWTATATARQLELAEQSIHRLPALHAATLAGHLDAAKARVCYQTVQVLDDDQTARAIIDRVLPEASEKTTAQLRAKLTRLVIKADPYAARKRYRNGMENRRVDHGQEHDGTWLLGGRFLPAAEAIAAYGHLEALATALHNAGDPRSLDQLRADLLLELLSGKPVIVPPAPAGPADANPDADPADPTEPPTPAVDAALAERSGGGSASSAAVSEICPTCRGVPGRGGLELTVPLSTLMDLSEDPGQFGSWGPVIADVARAAAADLTTAPWRFSVTNADGRVIWHGPTRRRPTAEHAAYVR